MYYVQLADGGAKVKLSSLILFQLPALVSTFDSQMKTAFLYNRTTLSLRNRHVD